METSARLQGSFLIHGQYPLVGMQWLYAEANQLRAGRLPLRIPWVFATQLEKMASRLEKMDGQTLPHRCGETVLNQALRGELARPCGTMPPLGEAVTYGIGALPRVKQVCIRVHDKLCEGIHCGGHATMEGLQCSPRLRRSPSTILCTVGSSYGAAWERASSPHFATSRVGVPHRPLITAGTWIGAGPLLVFQS
jgi:hypothetical protein